MMSGHPAYAGLGGVGLIVGLLLLFTAWRTHRGSAR